MIKIAITGNIASGKSQVEKILSSKGYMVIDTDKINNDLINFDKEVINEIKSIFGPGSVHTKKETSCHTEALTEVSHQNSQSLRFFANAQNDDLCKRSQKIFDNEKISKQKLSEIVFNSAEKRRALENIMHKKILEKINEIFNDNINEKYIFVSVPLLFEAGWENKFDKIIFVSADEKIRLKRLILRNHLTEEQAIKRINAQQNETEKLKKSDFIIYNNSNLEDLKIKTLNVLTKLK